MNKAKFTVKNPNLMVSKVFFYNERVNAVGQMCCFCRALYLTLIVLLHL